MNQGWEIRPLYVNFGPKSSSFRCSEAPAMALPGGGLPNKRRLGSNKDVPNDLFIKVIINIRINPIMLEDKVKIVEP